MTGENTTNSGVAFKYRTHLGVSVAVLMALVWFVFAPARQPAMQCEFPGNLQQAQTDILTIRRMIRCADQRADSTVERLKWLRLGWKSKDPVARMGLALFYWKLVNQAVPLSDQEVSDVFEILSENSMGITMFGEDSSLVCAAQWVRPKDVRCSKPT